MDSAAQSREDEDCPVCHNPLPRDTDASESHVATCIENQLFHLEDNKRKSSQPLSKGARLFNVQGDHIDTGTPSLDARMDAQPAVCEEDRCPVCSISLFSKDIGDSESAREAHVMACVEALESRPSGSVSNNFAPHYGNPPPTKDALPQASSNSLGFFSRATAPALQVIHDESGMGNSNSKEERKDPHH
jgi:hypothetical protein